MLNAASAAATVRVASFEVVVPHVLVNTARNVVPLIPTVGSAIVSGLLVLPGMSTNPEPVFACHCRLGGGIPVAVAENDASAPYVIDASVGCVPTVGPVHVGATT
jgi:hypothetical protein